MNKVHCHTPGSVALSIDSGSAIGSCDIRMSKSDWRMHPARSLSSSLPALTTLQTLMSIDYYLIQVGLILHNTVESFLSCSCYDEDPASGKTLSGLSCASLPVHGRIYGSRAKNLFQVTWPSCGCLLDHAFEVYLSDLSGCLLH
jgi:hypothetical protein